jgi:hypothetical protein
MKGKSRAVVASLMSLVLTLGALGAATGVAHAAPAASAGLNVGAPAETLITPVHYRCVVRVCGPYRCVWVNRCRRPWWW